MKRTPAMKNSEKIWKLEYWEPVPQEPDEQNKIKDNEIQDDST